MPRGRSTGVAIAFFLAPLGRRGYDAGMNGFKWLGLVLILICWIPWAYVYGSGRPADDMVKAGGVLLFFGVLLFTLGRFSDRSDA
jgi:hypothetical protein